MKNVLIVSFLIIFSIQSRADGDLTNFVGAYESECDVITLSKSAGTYQLETNVKQGHGCKFLHLVIPGVFSLENLPDQPFPTYKVDGVLRKGNSNVLDLSGSIIQFNVFTTGVFLTVKPLDGSQNMTFKRIERN